jgi:NAD(P)-dependent dehydrogenase (short-subunit alcohol dehydrogenase family)
MINNKDEIMSIQTNKLAGKVAVVTGASKGIGAAIARLRVDHRRVALRQRRAAVNHANQYPCATASIERGLSLERVCLRAASTLGLGRDGPKPQRSILGCGLRSLHLLIILRQLERDTII